MDSNGSSSHSQYTRVDWTKGYDYVYYVEVLREFRHSLMNKKKITHQLVHFAVPADRCENKRKQKLKEKHESCQNIEKGVEHADGDTNWG